MACMGCMGHGGHGGHGGGGYGGGHHHQMIQTAADEVGYDDGVVLEEAVAIPVYPLAVTTTEDENESENYEPHDGEEGMSGLGDLFSGNNLLLVGAVGALIWFLAKKK